MNGILNPDQELHVGLIVFFDKLKLIAKGNYSRQKQPPKTKKAEPFADSALFFCVLFIFVS
jgi:hypothetical protein